MIFLGMSSSRFRAGLFGNGSVGGSPLFKYMADSKKRRRHAMAFGAFFGDGTGSGLSSRSVSNESLPSGPDSLGTFHISRNNFVGAGRVKDVHMVIKCPLNIQKCPEMS
jgi:hypothetical protein